MSDILTFCKKMGERLLSTKANDSRYPYGRKSKEFCEKETEYKGKNIGKTHSLQQPVVIDRLRNPIKKSLTFTPCKKN